MEVLINREAIFKYLTEPSPLFIKQVVDIAETKKYILVRDLQKMKMRVIPDTVLSSFESRLENLCQQGCKYNEYDGVKYLLIPKIT